MLLVLFASVLEAVEMTPFSNVDSDVDLVSQQTLRPGSSIQKSMFL